MADTPISSEDIAAIRQSTDPIGVLAQKFNLKPEDIEAIRTSGDALATTQHLGPDIIKADDK